MRWLIHYSVLLVHCYQKRISDSRRILHSEDLEHVEGVPMNDPQVLKKLECGFKTLSKSSSKSLLKKHLTRELLNKLKRKKTPTYGSTLYDCVQAGYLNYDEGVGMFAPDPEAYSVFAELFDILIEDYHQGFKKTDRHPPYDWGDVDSIGDLDPEGEFIISTRVRCARSLSGYPFMPCLTKNQYVEIEKIISEVLHELSGEFKGNYYPLSEMSKEVQTKLIDDHYLYKVPGIFLQSANGCNFWPTGRGIFFNEQKTFLVWCNEEDHIRIISMQMGGALGEVYRRLVIGTEIIEKRISFQTHPRLGFLTFCPDNLGSTIRASVLIRLPKLAEEKTTLEVAAANLKLQLRGTKGEHTEAEGGVYDISNLRRLGITECQAVKELYDGIKEIINLERRMK